MLMMIAGDETEGLLSSCDITCSRIDRTLKIIKLTASRSYQCGGNNNERAD
jgi:hypothetical protein